MAKNLTVGAIVFLVLIEIVLRVQQRVGPVWDLQAPHLSSLSVSEALNHRPPPMRVPEVFQGMSWWEQYDERGIRQSSLRPKADKQDSRILFMGDSFMRGYDDANTIAQYVWDDWDTKKRTDGFAFLEAGFTSYSPSIYTVMSQQLLPAVRPDFVVLSIDVTDFGDEWLRYKAKSVRDASGQLIAVKSSEAFRTYVGGFETMRSMPLYALRGAYKLYHTRLVLPELYKRFAKMGPPHLFVHSMDKSKAWEQKFSQEIDYFEARLEEMVQAIYSKMGPQAKQRVLFTFHPHLQNLLKSDAQWNPIVERSFERVMKKMGANYYNARADLARAFGSEPQNYFWPGDMHYNLMGLKIYAHLIGEHLEKMVNHIGARPNTISSN